jgi:YD repeat-containing protein
MPPGALAVNATTDDSFGRLKTRTVGNKTFTYGYDARGRMRTWTDGSTSATYEYDHKGRRILMSVGNVTYRFVYHGDDVVAEYKYNTSGATPELLHKRVYWILNAIDQRIGFLHLDAGGQKTFYYYLTDQVGSVMQVIREDGTVVNRYDYDAFGNAVEEGRNGRRRGLRRPHWGRKSGSRNDTGRRNRMRRSE